MPTKMKLNTSLPQTFRPITSVGLRDLANKIHNTSQPIVIPTNFDPDTTIKDLKTLKRNVLMISGDLIV